MRENAATGEPFFKVMGLVLIALVVAGFVPLAATRDGGMASIPLLLHLHGAVFFGWFVLFFVQARLPGNGAIRLHRQLGSLSIALAAAMVVLAYFAMRSAYSRPDFSIAELGPAASLMFPFTDIVNFVVIYSLALINRRDASAHKRLMLLAGILMIDPAVARITLMFGAPPPVILLLELALFAALFGYDMVTRRRPHWASVLGLGLFVCAMVAKLAFAGSESWAALVGSVFGAR